MTKDRDLGLRLLGFPFDPGKLVGSPRRIVLRWGNSIVSVLGWCGQEQCYLTPDLDTPTWVGLLASDEALGGPRDLGVARDIKFPHEEAVWPEFAPLLWILTGPPDGPDSYRHAKVVMVDRLRNADIPELPCQYPWVVTGKRWTWGLVIELEQTYSPYGTARDVSPAMRTLRRLRGWSQEQAAAAVGCSASIWRKAEGFQRSRDHHEHRKRVYRLPRPALAQCREFAQALKLPGLVEAFEGWMRRGHSANERRGGPHETLNRDIAT